MVLDGLPQSGVVPSNNGQRHHHHSDADETTPPRSPRAHDPIHPRSTPPGTTGQPVRSCASPSTESGGQRNRHTAGWPYPTQSSPDLDNTFARQELPPIRRPKPIPPSPQGFVPATLLAGFVSGEPRRELVGVRHRIHTAASGEPQPHSIATRHDDLLTRLIGRVALLVVAAPGLVGVGVGQILLHPGRRR